MATPEHSSTEDKQNRSDAFWGYFINGAVLVQAAYFAVQEFHIVNDVLTNATITQEQMGSLGNESMWLAGAVILRQVHASSVQRRQARQQA